MTPTDATAVPSPLPDPPHARPSLLQNRVGNDDAVADDTRDMRWQPMTETAMLTPESVFSAGAAEAGVVRADWSSTAATPGQQLRSDNTAAAAAGGPEAWGGDMALGGSDMTLTDEDLLDVAAVFGSEEELLEMGLV